MRHLNAGRKLGRTHSHRKATLSALSASLIHHKRIRTTTAKAKEARMVVEKLITRAKNAVAREGDAKTKDVHARREVFAFLRDRKAVSALFNDIAPKVASRPGGYTRVVKLGRRRGDGAEVAILELVDYNTGQEKAQKTSEKKPRAARKKEAKAKKGAGEKTVTPTSSEGESKSSEEPKQ
jgi:large subunit ribosomal protein L17